MSFVKEIVQVLKDVIAPPKKPVETLEDLKEFLAAHGLQMKVRPKKGTWLVTFTSKTHGHGVVLPARGKTMEEAIKMGVKNLMKSELKRW